MSGVSSWSSSLARSIAIDSEHLFISLHVPPCQRISNNAYFVPQQQTRLLSSKTSRTTLKLQPKKTPAVSQLKENVTTSKRAQPHVPVLLNEVVSTWIPARDRGGENDDTIYLVDGTVGGGGHALAALQSSPSVKLLAMDVDVPSLDAAHSKMSKAGFEEDVHVSYWHGSYATIGEALRETPGFPSKVDGILIDLGFGSAQLDNPRRGFSFRKDGPLDMRYDQSKENTFTAKAIVNAWSVKQLEELFLKNDEPMARVVAEQIVRWRDWTEGNSNKKKGFFKTTLELRHVIDTAVQRAKQNSNEEQEETTTTTALARRNDPNLIWRPDEKRGQHVSKSEKRRILRRFQETKPKNPQVLTRCFQALRIEVNKEMDHIHHFFGQVGNHLKDDGRLVVLSFHPNEDGMVENAMKQMCSSSGCNSEDEENDVVDDDDDDDDWRNIDKFEMITDDPIRPSREEVKRNRRARSARLRAIKRVGTLP